MNHKLQCIAAVPDLIGLQPTFRALPTVCAEMIGGEAVATQGEFEGFQTARQTVESDNGVSQRAGGIFRNANR